MDPADVHPDAAALLQQLNDVLDGLCELPVDTYSDEQILGVLRELETQRRRLAPVDHALIAQAEQRHLAATHGCTSTTVLLRSLLRVSAGEASARVKAAAALGPRRSLTGEALDPIYASIAAAQAAGTVGPDAARVIVSMIEKLPDPVRCVDDVACEAFLTEQAAVLDVDAVKLVARRLALTLDPDGQLKDANYRDQHRDLRLQVRPDGSCHGEFDGTAEFAERLQAVFDSLGRPKPEPDGTRDPRTPGQRRHDAVLDAFTTLTRTEQLPDAGGVTTTVLLTMSQEAFETGQGTAATGHGTILPAAQVLLWLGGDTLIVPVVLNAHQKIIATGTGTRLYSRAQRLAMTVRDGGCCFPGCDAPPQWTEAHHVIRHRDRGPTSTDNGCLLCSFHHRTFERSGWHCVMTNGTPHWIPPAWKDPTGTPIRNHTHQPSLV